MTQPDLSKFREIPDFPNYLADPTGRVWSRPRSHALGVLGNRRIVGGHFMKWLEKTGMVQVVLSRPGIRRTMNVGAIVLRTFVGPPPPGTECCHNDGDYRNNRLENLRWDTSRANQNDKRGHGTQPSGELQPCGEADPRGRASNSF